jgi:hypothetical protein
MVESATVNPKVLLELFSMYRDWQEERVEEHVFETKSLIEVNKKSESSSEESTSSNYVQFFEFYFIM